VEQLVVGSRLCSRYMMPPRCCAFTKAAMCAFHAIEALGHRSQQQNEVGAVVGTGSDSRFVVAGIFPIDIEAVGTVIRHQPRGTIGECLAAGGGARGFGKPSRGPAHPPKSPRSTSDRVS